MVFVSPALLALLPLALTPLAVHLLFKRRRATIDLPSLWLLRHVELRLSPRRKLREILLLIVRCLFVAALVLAVARPISRVAAGGAGGGVDYVVVLDNTASMQVSAGGASSFDIARRRVTELLDGLQPTDRALLLPVVRPDGWEAGELTRDRALLRRAADGLECSDGTGELEAVVREARRLAEEATGAGREIVVLSDFRGPAGRLEERRDLLLVDCAGAEPRPNVALELVSVEPPAPLAGRPVEVTVRLVNGAPDEMVRVLRLELAGRPVESVSVTVPASGSVLARLRVPRIAQVGWTFGRVALPEDGFLIDNEVGFVLRVRERLRAVVVDPALDAPLPDPEAGGRFLTRLLDPTGDGATSGIEVRRQPPGAALPEADALLVCGYGTLDRIGAGSVQRFAESGGLVAVFAERDDTGSRQEWLAARPAGAVRGREPSGSVRFAREGGETLADLSVRAQIDLVARDDARVILEFDGGRPALVVAPAGSGFSLCAGFGLAPAWGSFTFHPVLVAELHRLTARYARRPSILSARAGTRVSLPGGGAPFALVTRDGVPLGRYEGASFDLGVCLRAGIYAFDAPGEAAFQRYLAVLPAPEESRLHRPPLAKAGVVAPDEDFAALLTARRVGRDYSSWLLLAALALALAEALLANRARGVHGAHGAPASAPGASAPAAPETAEVGA